MINQPSGRGEKTNRKFMNIIFKNKIIIFLIFLLALSLRLYGLNWDQGNHLHPDERYLTMVTADIKLPNSIFQYFDNKISPLNPYNYPAYQFFVYGTFPIFITKYLSVLFNFDTYESIVLVGRSLSAIFDSINIFLLYFLALKIFGKKSKLIFLPSLLYATCVLPIQLSHFYAVDTFLNTFILATFTFLVYNLFLPASIFFGLALACKISALYFLPIIILYLVFNFNKRIVYFIIFSFLSFRLFQPYIFDGLFQINPHFIDNIKQLQIISAPGGDFPPAIQWVNKVPLLRSTQNIVFFGLGLPLSILFLFSLTKLHKKTSVIIFLSLLWIAILFLYQGSRFAHPMRYLLIIYPFICLFTSLCFIKSKSKILSLLLVCHFIYAIGFLNIYCYPHSRVQASTWIYNNITPGLTITNEYWDDPLPLSQKNNYSSIYNGLMLSPYDPDSPEKIQKLSTQIDSANYIFMSSNRLWGSIPLVPHIYPYTGDYYNNLFSGKISYKKVLELNSYPGFYLSFIKNCYYFGPSNFPGIQNNWFDIDKQCFYPGIYFRDDTAEESFTVYDHPKVLIFGRTD